MGSEADKRRAEEEAAWTQRTGRTRRGGGGRKEGDPPAKGKPQQRGGRAGKDTGGQR